LRAFGESMTMQALLVNHTSADLSANYMPLGN
jgi:hypothetical protein